MIFLIVVLALLSPCSSFLLDEISMDQSTYEACSTCDKRADRTCNAVAANAIREYLTANHIKLIINSGDGVQVTKSLPNQKVDTGHSCSKTAEARGVTVNAKMTQNSDDLDSLDMEYDDFIKNAFLAGDIPHQVTVKADIRIKFGSKILLGNCNTVGRKTCGVTGHSTGRNHVSVILAASDCTTSTLPDGTDIVQFELFVDFEGTPKPETYSTFTENTNGNGCSILGGLVTINGLMQKYANKYVRGNNAINEIRGPQLTARLETLLKAKLGQTVTIPVNIVGSTTKGRKKRAAQRGCQRMKCPSGFSRLDNTQKCQKAFRTNKPNCAVYGAGSSLYERKFGTRTYYWCHVNMIPQ